MEIKLRKSQDEQIGNVRVSPRVYATLDRIAAEHGVSKQEIIRSILEEVIESGKLQIIK